MVLSENLINQLSQSPLGRKIHENIMAEHFESHAATLCQRNACLLEQIATSESCA